MTEPASKRVTMRRGTNRAEYDAATMRQVLDDGMVAHVGVSTDEGPIVLPMAYGRTEDVLYLHGAVANAMLRAGTDVEVCVTVTLVDGLVVARTPFHNSMNYRSVVVRGKATKIEGDDNKLAALKIINDHIVDIWDTARPPSATDLKKTLVLELPLDEMSAKIRAGDPVDEDDDMSGPHWAGVLPLERTWGDVVPASDLTPGIETPAAVTNLSGQRCS